MSLPIKHEIDPVYNEDSRVLILGSFPSVKSRESGFFYGHPQNRFWKVLSGILDVPLPVTVEEKKQMLLENHIAVWDVIGSCRITGSSDSSIKDVVPNDFTEILGKSSIERIYSNGATSWSLYKKYILKETGIEALKLPSTSPANAAWNLERLKEAWKVILEGDSGRT